MPDMTDSSLPPRPAGPFTVSRAGDMAWSGIQTFAKAPPTPGRSVPAPRAPASAESR